MSILIGKLKSNYDFSIPFALISKEEYLEERAALPKWWNEKLARRDVLFFSLGLDKSEVFDFIAKAAFYNEIVHVGSHALFWGKYDEHHTICRFVTSWATTEEELAELERLLG